MDQDELSIGFPYVESTNEWHPCRADHDKLTVFSGHVERKDEKG